MRTKIEINVQKGPNLPETVKNYNKIHQRGPILLVKIVHFVKNEPKRQKLCRKGHNFYEKMHQIVILVPKKSTRIKLQGLLFINV